MNSISVYGNLIRGIAKLASVDESHYVLNGVCVETGPEGIMLIATDGRRMGIYKADYGKYPEASFIIPTDVIKSLGSKLNSKAKISLSWEEPAPDKKSFGIQSVNLYTVGTRGRSLNFEPIQGNYPNWRHVMPASQDWKPLFWDISHDLLQGFREAIKIIKPSAHVRLRGTTDIDAMSVFAEGDNDFFGVLMPMRTMHTFKIPTWAMPKTPAPAPVVPPPAFPTPGNAATTPTSNETTTQPQPTATPTTAAA